MRLAFSQAHLLCPYRMSYLASIDFYFFCENLYEILHLICLLEIL